MPKRAVMTRSLPIARLLVWALLAALLLGPTAASADQAQYLYDEQGRLVGVIDADGNTAVYLYDEVGNLLAIRRFAAGDSGVGIFLLSPSSALVGAQVQIRGFGFGSVPTDNQVKFNGVPATVLAATTSSLLVTVPAAATSGPVTVTSANGTATSPQAFTVLVPPIIDGIEPATVARGVTTRVVITGFNLASATEVRFSVSGITAAFQPGVTSQRLPLNVTVAATVPPGAYRFSVTTPAGTAESGSLTLSVVAGAPGFSVTRISVFFPFPAQGTAPSGPGMDVSPPTSVFLPFPSSGVAPSGPGMDVAPPTSVQMP